MTKDANLLIRSCGALAAALLLSHDAMAMGRVNEERAGRVVVKYWEKWTEFEGEAMQAVVDDFNASQDRIFVEKLTVSGIDRKMLLATAGGNPPDIAGLWSWRVNNYADKGALMPLNKYCAKYGITRDRYIPVYWEICSHRGFVWALPTTPATLALHWNKKMFRDAGLDPNKPPSSIAELDALAEKLTVVRIKRNGKAVKVRYPDLTPEEKEARTFEIVQLGYSPSEPGWWNSSWCYWFGGQLWDGSRKMTVNSPENIASVTWFQSYARKYGLENMLTFGSSFGNFQSPQNPFLSGQIAMVLQGVWMYNFIDKFAPSMEWAAAPFPASDPEKYPMVTLTECDILCIPKGAKHPDEAFEFIAYVNSQKPMEKLNLGQRKFSPLAETSPDFVKAHPNPYIQLFIDMAKSPHARYVPRIQVWDELDAEMGVASDQAFRGLKTPEEALATVQERMQWRLDRILRRWDLIEAERLEEWSQ